MLSLYVVFRGSKCGTCTDIGWVDWRERLTIGTPAASKFTWVVLVWQLFDEMRISIVRILTDLWRTSRWN